MVTVLLLKSHLGSVKSSPSLGMLQRLARLTQPDFKVLAASRGKAQLLTIPYSHFCEFGAWALHAARIPFEEQAFGPGGHVLPLLRLRLGDGEQRHISSTSAVAKPSRSGDDEVAISRRPGGSATAVPACVLPDGRVLEDSWSIARFATETAGIAPIPDGLQSFLDTRLGPLTRQLSYTHLFAPNNLNVWNGLVVDGTSAAWRAVWWGAGARMTRRMTKIFSSADAEATALCKQRLHEAFATLEVEHGVGALGQERFLGGKTPGMADIALAALAAPAVQPELYCDGRYAHWFELLLRQDPALAEEVAGWRETAVGRHSLRVYAACRREPLVKP